MEKEKIDMVSDNILYVDDFLYDIAYFDNISLKRTFHFFVKNKDLIDNKIAILVSLLHGLILKWDTDKSTCN